MPRGKEAEKKGALARSHAGFSKSLSAWDLRRRTSNATWQFLHVLQCVDICLTPIHHLTMLCPTISRPGRLKALTLAPGSVETAPKALGANIQCLRGLISLSIFTDVGKGYAVDGPVNGVLSEWLELAKPTLTQLSLTSNTTSTWNTCKIRVPQGLQLKKLRLVDGACRLPGLQHLFCDGTLEYLSLDCRRLCVPSSQLCREVSRVAQSLRGLHIQVPIDLRATETRDTLATMLSSVRNVRILHLQAGLDYLVGNVTNLPTSVRRLAIDVKPTGRDDQERAIACLNAVTRIANAVLQEDLPSLAHLSVTCSTLKQLSDFDIDRAVFEQSITAAAEKGITLEFMDWFPEQVE